MKIVICISRDSERSGGSFRVAEVAIRSLLRQGVDVHAVIGYGSGGRIKQLLHENCHLINAHSWKDLGGWVRMRNLVKRLAPDAIHFASASNWMIASTLGLKPVRIMHQHFRPNIGPGARKHIRSAKWRMVGAHRTIAISHEAARQLVDLCEIHPQKIITIHNAIDSGYLQVDHRPKNSEVRRLGMAIRVVEDKGVEDALNLIALMPMKFTLTIAGDGPALKRFKNRASQMGLSDRVEWLGVVSDIQSFYNKIDYYLYMSWYEGFGLSVAEAMACGIPVVGLLGAGEIAEPEYPLVTPSNSLLIPRSSLEFCGEHDMSVIRRLQRAIVDLDADSEIRRRMVECARTWVRERFSSDLYGKRLHQLYTETIRHPEGAL